MVNTRAQIAAMADPIENRFKAIEDTLQQLGDILQTISAQLETLLQMTGKRYGPARRVSANETTHGNVESATERTREASLSDLELSMQTVSPTPSKDKNAIAADGVYGSVNLNSLGKFLDKLHEMSTSSCLAMSLSPLPLLPPNLPLSLTVPNISKDVVSVCIVPLASCPSSLSLSLDRRTELVMVMGSIQRCTWLLKSGVEGSKSQLAASKGKIGMNLTLVCDELILALSVNMIWFRGELITMLCGRFCSLRKKEEEEESRSEWQAKKLRNLT